jgi:hypothetical protein
MRTVHWFFLVSAALFVFGIGFVIAGARGSRVATASEAPTADPAPALTPVASVKQIMNGIVAPAATVVFESVATTISAAGIKETAPRTEEEWAVVGNSAAALAEAANLLVIEGRVVDREDWVMMSRALADAGTATLKAVEAKSTEGILAAGEAVNTSCDNCHQKYMR